MKKILALLLSVLLVFGMTACGDKGTAEEFQKPENYATVLLVTINPQFRLYLDAEGEVLAVEPVNDDAKGIADKLSVKTGTVDEVMESLVKAVDEGGFVKDGEVTVDLKVDEVKDEAVDTDSVLEAVQKATDDGFKKLEIKAEVTVTVVEKDEASEPISTADSSEDTSSDEHKHEFAAATCTAPKTCACGATEGAALGHKFSGAACTVCGAKNPNYVTPISQKGGSWVGQFWYNNSTTGKTYYSATINFSENLITGGGGGTALDIMGSPEAVEEAKANGDAFQFDGEWWVWGFGGDRVAITNIAENGNTVTITTVEGTLTLTRTGENSMKVTSSSSGLMTEIGIKTGTIFTKQ